MFLPILNTYKHSNSYTGFNTIIHIFYTYLGIPVCLNDFMFIRYEYAIVNVRARLQLIFSVYRKSDVIVCLHVNINRVRICGRMCVLVYVTLYMPACVIYSRQQLYLCQQRRFFLNTLSFAFSFSFYWTLSLNISLVFYCYFIVVNIITAFTIVIINDFVNVNIIVSVLLLLFLQFFFLTYL